MNTKTCECSADMRGDVRRVLDALVTALASNGFRVERRTAGEVELIGPKSFGSHHNPFVGASRIVARSSGRRLVLSAELGGIEWLRRFLLIFPLSLGAFFAIVFGVVFPLVHRDKLGELGWRALLPIAPVLGIFLFVGFVVRPLAVRKFESKTRAALDALTTSVASIGADG